MFFFFGCFAGGQFAFLEHSPPTPNQKYAGSDGDEQFFAARVRRQQIAFIGKLFLEHVSGSRLHPLITLLNFDLSNCKRISRKRTYRDQLLRDLRIQFPDQLGDVFRTARITRQVAREVGQRQHAKKLRAIAQRRAREANRGKGRIGSPSRS